MRTRDFSFGAAILDYEPGPEEELRAVLQQWVDSFHHDSFATDVSSKGVAAWSVDCDAAVRHTDLLADRLSNVLGELRAL